MKKIFALILCLQGLAYGQDSLLVVPRPASFTQGAGRFQLTRKTVITATDEGDRKTAALFNAYLQKHYGFTLDIDRQESRNYIRLSTRKFIRPAGKDGYAVSITPEGVTIEGDTYAGTFYGVQTLQQLLPAAKGTSLPFTLPAASIVDSPRFSYRGMHLDVSRHFFDLDFVKQYIDYLAYHKLNYFHWHLTDDQGWRIEIKRYPELTATGAYRNGTIIGRYPGTGNDNQRYGGYYTQDQVREVVRYAAERHITVVPEIEMPGHSSAAIAAYPWLSCFPQEPTKIPTHPSTGSQQAQASGKVKLVQETWGVFTDVYCAGNDSTFHFLEGVMAEVLELFPSNYIHVGGDESPKANWKRCPRCQARIRSLGLKDEHELQSYFIQRMEKYLNARGRVLIGWDEILEGGLAPNAVVMSWRGEKGGIEAARQNHQVIMTPQRPVYFDHTQTKNEDSVVIGGFNPLEAVYGYEPVPRELAADKMNYIVGAQANLWTEYVKYPSKAEYMVFPRMSALAEVLWSPKESRSWGSFERRLPTLFSRYGLWKANYSRAYFDIRVSLRPTATFSGIELIALPSEKGGELLVEAPGRLKPRKYTSPLLLTSSTPVTVSYRRGGEVTSRVSLQLAFNKATGKKVTIASPPNERYPGQGGAFSLVNGIWSTKGLSYPDWLGWIGDDIRATIDLGRSQVIDSVRMHTLDQNGSWIYLPAYVEIELSDDGKAFQPVGRSSSFVSDTLTMGWITVPVAKRKARYVRLTAKNYGLIPEGKPGGGTRAWVFADEIQVY
jgi:hexosaminidase